MNTTELIDKVADACGDGVNLERCECVEARGFMGRLESNPYCGICDGTGKPTVEMLVSKLDSLSEDIDELLSTASDICQSAKGYLELAWFATEDGYRKLTGHCSYQGVPGSGHEPGRYCACCAQYDKLKPIAARIGSRL